VRRVGPAFLIALVLSGLLLWWNHVQGQERRRPVVIAQQIPASGGPVGMPDPAFVLARAPALSLPEATRRQVAGLAQAWQTQTADLRRRLDRASAALQARLDKAPPGNLTPADFRAEAEQVQSLSAQLAGRRREFWPRLQQVLTPEQQHQAQESWADAHRLRPPAAPAGSQ
jgi:hypothetical protein